MIWSSKGPLNHYIFESTGDPDLDIPDFTWRLYCPLETISGKEIGEVYIDGDENLKEYNKFHKIPASWLF